MAIQSEANTSDPSAPSRRVVTSICGICPGACGVNVELVDGRIDRITPLKDHPVGIICVRGAYSKEIVYSPDRLLYPLARVGGRGEGRFERTAWDEAMGAIAAKLQDIKAAYGPQAVAMHVGRGGFEAALADFGIYTLLYPFGSPNNAGVGSICYNSYGVLAALPTFGVAMRNTFSDYENAKVVVVWGANPATDSPPTAMRAIMRAKSRGAHVIAIDHRRSEMADRADAWVPIRPGTDGALALGLINVIVEEHLYDADFVNKWTTGFTELSAYVREFSPTAVEGIAGVPAAVTIDLAHAIAGARHACLNMYTGLEYTDSGVQNIRAVYCLWAVTGNLDVPGGLVFRAGKAMRGRADIRRPEEPRPIGYDRYPMFCDLTRSAQFMEMPRAVLHDDPYPVRALLITGSSILTSYPNTALWREVLSRLDLLVVMDRFMTADAAYADYVLPATTYYENASYERYPDGYVQLRQRVIEPLGEARSDFAFAADLAQRLGYGDLYAQGEEQLLEFTLGPAGVDVARLRENPGGLQVAQQPITYRKYETGLLRPDGKPGFNTPSGKVELLSGLLAKYGHDPLPIYVEPREGPVCGFELTRRYPLVLNTGARIQSAFRSQHLNIPGLLKLQPEPLVTLHTADAMARGIKDGDRVYVETRRGRVPYVAHVTDGIIQGAVEINAGGGGPLQPPGWREANANILTDADNRDPISGFPVFKALLCEVRKAD